MALTLEGLGRVKPTFIRETADTVSVAAIADVGT